jgi:hypothetical protein
MTGTSLPLVEPDVRISRIRLSPKSLVRSFHNLTSPSRAKYW